MAAYGPRPTPRGLRAASPLTEVHRPRTRQAVDVVGAPAYDPQQLGRGRDPDLRRIFRALRIAITEQCCSQGISSAR
jgi:hypothetical protein